MTKMKSIAILGVILFSTNFLFAQENDKGNIVVGISIGPNFANFINSEAPHKINMFGSDIRPILTDASELTKSVAYTDYKVSLLKDVLTGISMGIQLEYFIKKNLSIQSGIYYESKGINLNYSNRTVISTTPGDIASESLDEKYKIKFNNNYLTIPILFRKYLSKKQHVFFEGGIYTGYLISSKITVQNKKTVSDATRVLSQYTFEINNHKDIKKEYTHIFDFGFSAGAGFIKSISEKFIFKTEMLLNFGMAKLDSKYNNEYLVEPVSMPGTNYSKVLSTNYFGLNSNSKNINFNLTIGLGYKIGK